MFNARYKKNRQIYQILDTSIDSLLGITMFLVWYENEWRWLFASDFYPPNVEIKERVIVAGSRNFQNYPLLSKELDKIQSKIGTIVCGDAKGADEMGARYGKIHNIPVKHFPADWGKWGQSAGFIRNKEMADYADSLVAFWDGASTGTKDMIEKMQKQGKEVKVIYFNKKEEE